MAGKKKAGLTPGKIIIFVVEILIIVALVFVLRKFICPGTDPENKLNYVSMEKFTPEEIGISEEVQQQIEEGGKMQGYLNIALFGIDSTSPNVSALEKGYRSDCIMIASINQDTGDIKLVSVYRDTYLNTGKDTFQKCNAAYALGGGNAAVSMLNSNLDLDITNWMAVSYRGLADAIDSLGGIYIDVDEAEIGHLNAYQGAVAEILSEDYVPLAETGYQKVNGLQAAGYCRIRYTAGDDFKRTERQREVLQALVNAAKGANTDKLVETFNKVSGNVLTSIDKDTLLSMVKNISKYSIVEEGGFPEESLRTTGTIGAKGSCVIPISLKDNDIWLHKFLFGDEDYVPSKAVEENSAVIYNDTSAYVGY